MGRDHALLGIVDVRGVMIEGGESADRADHDGHRMRVAAEALEEARHLVMDHGVARDGVVELSLLSGGGELPVKQQIAGLEEIAVISQLLDGVAAMQQNAFVAIDIRDLGLAGGRRQEARIEGEAARGVVEFADVDDIRANGARFYGHIDGDVADFEVSALCTHCTVPFCSHRHARCVDHTAWPWAGLAVVALRKKLSHQRAPFKQMKAELWSNVKFG